MNKHKTAASLASALLLSLTLLLAACAGNPPANSPADASASATGASSAKPLEQTSFNLGHLNSTAHLLGFVAEQEGFFKEEGLDVTLTLFSSAGEMSAALESGKLDAAFIGSVPTITFQSQGHPLSIFGGAMTNGHGYVIKSDLVPEGFKRGDISVLKGRNVASVKNSVQDLELQVLLKNANLRYKEENPADNDVNVVYFESQKDAYNALAGNEIDAASIYSPYASLAVSQGYTVVYYCNEEDEFTNQPCCRQVAPTEALTAKPNTYEAFERGLIKAYRFSRENEEKTIDDVKAYIDIDREFIRTEVYGGYSLSSPDPDKTATKSLHDEVISFGYTTDYDIEPLYNTDIYKNALDSIIAANPDDAVYAEIKTRFEANNQ